MSRRKLPHVSWRTCRITAAAALVALLTAALLTYPADAKPDKSARTSALLLPALHIGRALDDGHNATVGALQAQAAAQAAAHRKAEAAAAAKHKAEAAARRQAEAAADRRAARAERQAQAERRAQAERERTQQRAARSATRTTETPSVSGARSYARSRLSGSQYSCLDSLIHRESGWNHRATNPSSGAYGLMQALPGFKMSSAGADWRTNPVTQIRWGLSYISSRYGSPCGAWNFWQKNRWY